jgi:glutathione S-transferase
MRLYQFPHSPYCIPIVQAARALRSPLEVVNVANGDRSEILRITGGRYYQVPVLEDDAGTFHFETPEDPYAVPRMLDPSGRLFPECVEGLQQILLRYIENDLESVTFRLADPFYLDTISDPIERGLILRHKERKFGRGCVEQWRSERAELLAEAANLLRPLDQMLAQAAFLTGDVPVYSDFALAGVIGNFTFQNWNPLPDGLPDLAGWHARLLAFEY